MSHDLAAILKRIEKRLAKLKFSESQACLNAGLSRTAVSTIRSQLKEGSQKGLSTETLAALAPILLTTPQWLFAGIGAEELTGSREQITPFLLPILGVVSAGTWVEIDGEVQGPPVSYTVPLDPRYPPENQYGVLVRGNSINRVALDGDVLIACDVHKTKSAPRSGDLVVAVRTQGDLRETTAKRLVIHQNDTELRHESNDPRYAEQKSLRFRTGSGTAGNDKIEIVAVIKAAYRVLG